MRLCSGWALDKLLEEFGNDARASDGKQSSCRGCAKDAKRQRYAANPEHYRARQREYCGANRDLVRAISAATRKRNAASVKRGKKAYYERVKLDPAWREKQRLLRLKNREEKKAYDEAYNAANREKIVRRSLEWASRNKERRASISKAYDARRRTTKKQGDPTGVIHAWEMAQPKKCYWCGASCADNYHVDHYEPLSKGGANEVSNLVIACPPCNQRKSAKDPYQFAQQHSGRLF